MPISPDQQTPSNEQQPELWKIMPDPRKLDGAQQAVENRLTANNWSEGDVIRLPLAFREGLMNAMVYGNMELPPDFDRSTLVKKFEEYKKGPDAKPVEVRILVTPEVVEIVIQNTGKGFDFSQLAQADQSADITKRKGRGRFIMQESFPIVHYEDEGRRLILRKERSKT